LNDFTALVLREGIGAAPKKGSRIGLRQSQLLADCLDLTAAQKALGTAPGVADFHLVAPDLVGEHRVRTTHVTPVTLKITHGHRLTVVLNLIRADLGRRWARCARECLPDARRDLFSATVDFVF
jgi:hypothetical protein